MFYYRGLKKERPSNRRSEIGGRRAENRKPENNKPKTPHPDLLPRVEKGPNIKQPEGRNQRAEGGKIKTKSK
jgi:hypothetical protein